MIEGFYPKCYEGRQCAKTFNIELFFISQFLLSKANMVKLELGKAHQSEFVETKVDLARVHELYLKIREENEVINKQNVDLTKCLAVVEIKIEGLTCELATER